MRRMLTSRQIEILDSMTEEVFESGVWEIDSGAAYGELYLKDLEVGYQYKIYLNATSSDTVNDEVIRLETELGLSQDYINFLFEGKYMDFVLGDIGGGTSFRLRLNESLPALETLLSFNGTLTSPVNMRYLITRHKLYI